MGGRSAAALKQIEPAPTEPEVSAAELAREALDSAKGDRQLAIETLTDRIVADPLVVKDQLRRWARAWATERIAEELSHRRTRIWNNAGASDENFKAFVDSEHQRLMDQPLFGGKRLGNATAAEVRESAERYATQAKSMALYARWQFAVADAAEKNAEYPEATVSQTLSEAALIRLKEEAGAE